MQTSESEDELRPRYSNKKIRKEIEVDITDLVVAGVISKDNPATQSALEDSISADLDNCNKKLKDATTAQKQLGMFLYTRLGNIKSNSVSMGETLDLLIDTKIVLDMNITTHKKLQNIINSNVSL